MSKYPTAEFVLSLQTQTQTFFSFAICKVLSFSEVPGVSRFGEGSGQALHQRACVCAWIHPWAACDLQG